LDDCKVHGGSIGCSQDGVTLALTIWLAADAAVAALEDLAQKHGRICLHGCREPLLLDLVTLERKEPRKIRIVARIVGGLSNGI
jgi:hypothetical protein